MNKQTSNSNYEQMLQELLSINVIDKINPDEKIIELNFNNNKKIKFTKDGMVRQGESTDKIIGYTFNGKYITSISEYSDPPKFGDYYFHELIDFDDITEECKNNIEKMYFVNIL